MTSSDTLSMSSAGQALAQLLSRQLDVVLELRDAMRHKQRLLVANDTAALSESSQHEEDLARRLRRLEQQRVELAGQLSGLEPQQAAQLHSSELLTLTGLTDPGLAAISDELRTLIHELQLLQDDNRVLTTRLVEYGSLVLKLLTQGEEQSGYTNHGRPAENLQRRELLNCRV